MLSSNELIIRSADFKDDYRAIFDIRDIVYIQEQNCPYDEEFDGFDDDSDHFLAYIDNRIVGYCRLRMIGRKAKMERFAVYKEWRGRGIGKALVIHLLSLCEEQGIKEKYLNAQTRVKGFYEKLGFKQKGELFFEAGIEHIAMDYCSRENKPIR